MKDRHRCNAINKDGTRCKRRGMWTIPNCYLYKDKRFYGREIHLCMTHYLKYHRNKYLKLSPCGYLQPYNQYKYGTAVYSRIINWDKKPKVVKTSKYWINRELESIV